MEPRPHLRYALLPRADLDAAAREAMFAVFNAHFADADRAVFEADLAEKDEVVLLYDDAGVVRGFSTLRTWEDPERGVSVLFSGDTVVDQAAWGSPVLARAWLDAALRAAAAARGPLWWMLICSGYRTYRFLPLFFREFWPRYDAPTPPLVAALREGLARARYGPLYEGGVVRLPDGARVRPEVGGITESRLQNPHVAYFAEANPGHARGEELVCLTRVDPENFTPAGLRILAALRDG